MTADAIASGARWQGPVRAAAVGAMVVGATLRLLAFADRRPLWFDELMLTLSIGTRSYADLAHQPLDYGQTAPLFFLWAERLATRLAGMGEWTLRALPLVSGLALLPFLWSAGRRLLGEREALLALVLAALSQPLIYYSNEAKQYASDAFFSTALVWGAAGVLTAPTRRRRWSELTIIGVLAAGFSQPSVFVLVAVLAALALSPEVRAAPKWRARLAALSMAWGALAATLYALVYRAAATDPYMRRVWSAVFLTPGVPDFTTRVGVSVRELLLRTVLPDWPEATRTTLALAALAYVGGAGVLWLRANARHGRAPAALLTLPVVGVLAASALGAYPVAPRLVLFLAPVVLLTYGTAVTAVIDAWLGPTSPAGLRLRNAVYAVLVLFVAWWRFNALREEAVHPRRYEDTRDMIAFYLRRAGSDPVYLYAGGVPSWAFYTTDWRAPNTARLAWLANVAGPSGPAFENIASRGRRVSHEGDSLVYETQGRLELIGIGIGAEYLEGQGRPHSVPDSGWAENEARRLREAVDRRADGGRSAWVYFTHHSDVQREALLAALRRIGASAVVVRSADTAVLYHVTFEPQP